MTATRYKPIPRQTRLCQYCGVPMANVTARKRYCSDVHRNLASRRRRFGPALPVGRPKRGTIRLQLPRPTHCAGCGEHKPLRWPTDDPRFCMKDCAATYALKSVTPH